MGEFTKGPWVVRAGTNCYVFDARIMAGDKCIAFADGDLGPIGGVTDVFTPSADAALIAAAPELLEALEKAIEWDAARGYVMPYRVRDPMTAAIRKARTTNGGNHG